MAIDGSVYPNPLGISVDFSNDNFDNGFLDGFQSLAEDSLLADSGLGGITLTNYRTGFTLYRFSMSNRPNLQNDHIDKLRSAPGRINLQFRADSKNEPLSMIVYSLTPELITCSSERLITKGYVS